MALFKKKQQKKDAPAAKEKTAQKEGRVSPVFDQMMSSLSELSDEEVLRTCSDLNPSVFRKIPLRYRLIALGFVQGMELDGVNANLQKAGYDRLYARNYMEAGFIYAFGNHMTFDSWTELRKECEEKVPMELIDSGQVSGKDLTLENLQAYLYRFQGEKESAEGPGREDGLLWETEQMTRQAEKKILSLSADRKDFILYIKENIMIFSNVREKARYYYCKYLYGFLMTRVGRYLRERRKHEVVREDSLFTDLSVLKGVTPLKRENPDPDKAEQMLMQARLSCGAIYDAFNYFYFEYASIDWMEVLLEYYGNLDRLPEQDKKALCRSLRIYTPAWKDLSDDEILEKERSAIEEREKELDDAHSTAGENKGYQRNRSGENSVRNYLTGKLDIDRTTLITYLIFFDRNIDHQYEEIKKAGLRSIDADSLDTILGECGFRPLDPEYEFDDFILRYLASKEPDDLLMEVVTEYALQNRNFFLYHMYNDSYSIASQGGGLYR